MKVGFIGLGTLGITMARRFISEGVELVVWNRSKEKAEGIEAKLADSPADVVSKSDIVFLNLFDSAAVEAVLSDDIGILSGKCKGKIIVDTTTNHFDLVERFYNMLEEKGAYYLEAPVLGSVVPASQGNLTVLVSGEASAYEKAKPYIEKIGKTIFFLEKRGLATKMKLINNLTLGSFMATIAEALIFGEEVGIEKEEVLNILAAGGGNSLVLNAKRDKLLKEDFSVHFSAACIYKDLHCLQDLARDIKKPLFTGSVVKELFGKAISEGMEELDFSAVYKTLKK